MTNRIDLKRNQELLIPLDEARNKDGRRGIYISSPQDTTLTEWESALKKQLGKEVMVLPEGFSKMPWAWQCGYWSGCWQPTEKDKEPPRNPITKGTVPYREWEEGFKAAREARRCTDS